MYDIDDLMEAHCPQCANDFVYVERRVTAAPDLESDAYLCRCGKCGWRFRVFTPEFVADAPSLNG